MPFKKLSTPDQIEFEAAQKRQKYFAERELSSYKRWSEKWSRLLDEERDLKRELERERKRIMGGETEKKSTGELHLGPPPKTSAGFIGWLARIPEYNLDPRSPGNLKIPLEPKKPWELDPKRII